MFNETQKEKIQRFVSDVVMFEAVRTVLENSFLKPPKSNDVQFLAASRIALDLLGEGMRELSKFKKEPDKNTPFQGNVAL